VDIGRTLEPAPDDLALAAECLDRGDQNQATTHLTRHITRHPTEVMTRAYLAELLFQQGRHREAEAHFNQVVHDAVGLKGKVQDHCVHCHTRLMQIAEATENAGKEHLHRGIGLVLLVRRWDSSETRKDDVQAERTLVQAVRALREAQELGCEDPRGWWYLAEAYRKLGQAGAAETALRRAQAAPPGMVPEGARGSYVKD
jgi:cytochrome c-type biogenesis protein CcmH/NrfG